METETQERFKRIETNLDIVSLALRKLTESLDRNVTSQETLTQAIHLFIDASDARMGRIEESLNALIRAITADHSNGKGKH